MSHFSVLVVTNEPGRAALATALQRYHEFECTGIDDEYVQTIDITAQLREEYATETKRQYVAPDGTRHDPYADRFYRNPTPEEQPHVGHGTGGGHGIAWSSRDWQDGRGYRPKVHFLPDGWTETDVPMAAAMSFADFCQEWHGIPSLQAGTAPDLSGPHKYGYVVLAADGEVITVYDRTNPKKQWDWWQLGGRFTGKLISKGRGVTGKPGLLTAPADADACDQCRVGDLDLPAMKARACLDRQLAWQEAQTGDPRDRAFLYDIGPDTTEAEYCEAPALQTFAILDHEGWYDKGQMGWWGVVHNERNDWPQRFEEYLTLLMQHPEKYVAVVDCHI
jgi:hypothetical protein